MKKQFGVVEGLEHTPDFGRELGRVDIVTTILFQKNGIGEVNARKTGSGSHMLKHLILTWRAFIL